MDVKCHVYHLNHPESRNQGMGGARASHSQRMTDPLGTSAGFTGFSDRKQVGQLIQATSPSAAGRILRAEKAARPADGLGVCARTWGSRFPVLPTPRHLPVRQHRGPGGLFPAHGLSPPSAAPWNKV